jgi:hypothetical protein
LLALFPAVHFCWDQSGGLCPAMFDHQLLQPTAMLLLLQPAAAYVQWRSVTAGVAAEGTGDSQLQAFAGLLTAYPLGLRHCMFMLLGTMPCMPICLERSFAFKAAVICAAWEDRQWVGACVSSWAGCTTHLLPAVA